VSPFPPFPYTTLFRSSESPATMFTSAHLLHLVFLYTVALFYGHVLGQVRHERARADRGFAWARELEVKVAERTEQLQRLYEECRSEEHTSELQSRVEL